MFDHIGVVFRDLKVAGDFYRAVLATIGVKVMEDHTQADGTGWLVFSTGAPESPFFVVAAGRPTFWREADVAGASPGAPRLPGAVARRRGRLPRQGPRARGPRQRRPGVRRGRYYCAFLIDPDGNNIEAGVYADA